MGEMIGIAGKRLLFELLQAGIMKIRGVDAGEEPFRYSSGHYGPVYVSMKELVGRKNIIRNLCWLLAMKITGLAPDIDFIAGNVSGGMIPGWLVSNYVGILRRDQAPETHVPFVYVREEKNPWGLCVSVVGIANNPEIPAGSNGLVVEELVNFASTTCRAAEALREAGYLATHAACIMTYENPEAERALGESGIKLIPLFTLKQLLETAELYRTHTPGRIACCRDFLQDPIGWQTRRGFQPAAHS